MFPFIVTLVSCVFATAVDDTKAIMDEWDKYMRGFSPDDMISFSIGVGEEETFIEKVTQPTVIRGTFFIPIFTTDTIDFKVYDPTGVMIYTKMMKKEAVFSFNATQEGDYKLVFQNKRAKEAKVVQLALDVARSEKEELSKEDIDPLEADVGEYHKKLMAVFYTTKLGELKSKGAFQEVQKINKKLMIMTFVETAAICGLTIWQGWYIKKLLVDPRLV